MHLKQTTELRDAACEFSLALGPMVSTQVEEQSKLLVYWLTYLSAFHRTNVADSLLDAASSSIREVAGLLSLGFARPALFSLRGQIDLLLAWLYFKDHGIEWSHVNETADGFKLKKELLQYLEQHVPKFGVRMGILRETKTRKELDPYRLLSAHIHAQSNPVLPVVVELKDLVRVEAICIECAEMAFEVSEYLNDVFLAVFLPNWASLPVPIQTAMGMRFQSAEQRGVFFA
jgi:hypothetical protein